MPRNADKIDYFQGLLEGFESFATISDPRTGGNTRHHFGEILFMAFAALLCGVRSYELMEEFCELREKWLRKMDRVAQRHPLCQHLRARFSGD